MSLPSKLMLNVFSFFFLRLGAHSGQVYRAVVVTVSRRSSRAGVDIQSPMSLVLKSIGIFLEL